MAYRFDGKVCLITGAASGIGRATALKMSSLGARLALSDINQGGLNETNTLCGGHHLLQVFDVGSSSACNTFIETIIKDLGRLDFVFNCAGVNPTAYELTETTDEYYDLLMNTNLRGTYNITRAAIPHLKEGAAIVNTSSVMGVTVAANYAIYCATKFGVVGFTKAMAMELGKKQIRVNAIAVSQRLNRSIYRLDGSLTASLCAPQPGYINTPTNAGVVAGPEAVAEQEKKIAFGRMGTAGEVADVVAFLFRWVLCVFVGLCGC
jgi:NAD(P)-dependent dehydrogenase (short-subunit alcohol dehydrogenase family)